MAAVMQPSATVKRVVIVRAETRITRLVILQLDLVDQPFPIGAALIMVFFKAFSAELGQFMYRNHICVSLEYRDLHVFVAELAETHQAIFVSLEKYERCKNDNGHRVPELKAVTNNRALVC